MPSSTTPPLLPGGLVPGQRRIAPGRFVMEPELVRAFAETYDPQPMHLDEAAARSSPFGGLTASGWQTLAATMRLMVDARLLGDAPIVGARMDEQRFLRPVRPGDVLSAEAEALDLRPSRSRPDRGLLRLQVTTFNQAGDAVVSQVWTLAVSLASGG